MKESRNGLEHRLILGSEYPPELTNELIASKSHSSKCKVLRFHKGEGQRKRKAH